MSELEHALRAALADPPAEIPDGVRNPLWDIEERIHQRRQKQRRGAIVALACAAVAAVVVPLSVYGTPGGTQTANTDSKAASGSGGGVEAVPTTVRNAAESVAEAPGSRADRTVEWVRTTAARWDELARNTGVGEPNIAVYVVQLRGHFRCDACSRPENAEAPTGVAQVVVVPVHPGQHYSTGFGPSKKPDDLSKLGAVHTFTLR